MLEARKNRIINPDEEKKEKPKLITVKLSKIPGYLYSVKVFG